MDIATVAISQSAKKPTPSAEAMRDMAWEFCTLDDSRKQANPRKGRRTNAAISARFVEVIWPKLQCLRSHHAELNGLS
ncbi:MAG: hypothetical protein AB7O60_03215 [Variibacter sp.]